MELAASLPGTKESQIDSKGTDVFSSAVAISGTIGAVKPRDSTGRENNIHIMPYAKCNNKKRVKNKESNKI